MTYARRTDANHSQLIADLRKTGRCLVESLARVGQGVPDLLVCDKQTSRVVLVEVKMPNGKLTLDQQVFRARGWPVIVASSAEDVLHALAVESVESQGRR